MSLGLIVHIVLFWSVFWTKEPQQRLKRPTRQLTEIHYFDTEATERSEVLFQEMTLFDPRPLLLPTEWNAANVWRLGEVVQEEQDLFPSFGPMFELEDGDYLEDFGNVAAYYERLTMAQADFDYELFAALGRESRPIAAAPEAGLELVVMDPSTGFETASTTIYNNVTESLSEQWPDWQPTSLLATVKDSFLVGGLAVVRSSGYVEADQLIQMLASGIIPTLGRLNDGVYLVEMAP